MDNDLERSVRFLEDATSASGRGLFKTVASQRKGISNLSITMTPYEMERIMQDKSILGDYDDTMNILIESNQMLSGSIIQGANPWKSTLENLNTEFFEILQNFSSEQGILEVLADLARCCSDAVNVIEGLKSKVAVSYVEEEKQLIDEKNTWRLLLVLYQDRLAIRNLMNDETILDSYTGLSEKLCVESLFKRDNLLRETQLVIDWLENCSSEKDNLISDYPDHTSGWENTLHQLKSAETIAFSSSRKIVNKLDPDAPNYQHLPLHDLDMEDEKLLSQIVFNKIRCGKLDEAQQICMSSGHAWRAALLEGWKLYHNPNIKNDEQIDSDHIMDYDQGMNTNDDLKDGEYYETEGNPSRDVWKLMAIQYCKKEYLRLEEKAAIAAYSGILASILPACRTWEDYLWAYLRAMVDIRVESEIRENVNKEYAPLPDWFWDQRMSLNEIFQKLESTSPQNVVMEAKSPEHIIQKLLILDEINQLVKVIEEWVSDAKASTMFLRFVTHLMLFLDQIGQLNSREIVETCIEQYVKRLWKLGETRLVAFYLSKVNSNLQICLYAKCLEEIVDNDERREALKYAEDFELSVFEITKKIVENVRNKPQEMENNSHLMTQLTETDLFKISSLDWILFYEEQRAEALIQSNAMIFTFLTLSKIDAAQLAFNKIPPESVEHLMGENTNKNLEKILKEHMSYKVYLEAHEGFNEWFQKYKSKPQLPEAVPESAPFTEKVAYQHRMAQYKTECERWKITTEHLAKVAKALLYNVLLFPDGWLTTNADWEYLRSICIPEVILLLYTVLSKSGLHQECVQLADIIASEKHQLYKVFSKEKLGELLLNLCESSVILLNGKQNPWEEETHSFM
ncbi:nuclear pore complex protein Nup107 [Coccinella septempunctata]|uniref:nuclear pore complex protein Nup107 n=1 Tax=Coccinella septempunctata TaxID=41139 RepID=UPI001D08D457|nr:nuclear pore complex protein Nup107 [Coccinella septempunctata]